MKKWIMAPLFALVLAMPAVSFAQAASPAKLALARQVVELQHGADQDALLADLAGGASSILVGKWNDRIRSEVPEAKQAEVADKLNVELKAFYDETLAMLTKESAIVEAEVMINLYAQKFSEDELKSLVALFSSPAFKKYQELMPELGEAYVRRLTEKLQSAVEARQAAFDKKATAIFNAAK